MNAVEIEQAVSDLVEAPFDRESFAFAFLEAFGNKPTTIKKLKVDRSKKGSSNHSDLEGGVLQRNNIHLLVCDEGKAEAENLVEGETLVCDYEQLADHFDRKAIRITPRRHRKTAENHRQHPQNVTQQKFVIRNS